MSIKEMRLRAKITQNELSLKLSIQRSTVAKWETGKSLPRAELLPKIAQILNCSVDELLRTGEQKESSPREESVSV